MTKPKILVTGATGKTGTQVVSQLREHGWPVRAVVRKEDHRSGRLRALGAEVAVAVADVYDYEQVREAMRGTRRAYYCPPVQPYMIQASAVFAAAARDAGLEAVVGLSQWLAGPSHPSLHTRQVWLVERLLASIPGVNHINLNPGYFADNYLRLIDFASLLRIFPVLSGPSLNALPSNEDIARCAVGLLIDPDRHAGRSYRPTGPTLLSGRDMARIVADVLGHPVAAVDLPFWMLERAARIQGEPAFVIASLRHDIEDHKAGAFAHGAPTDVVLELTGRRAEDFETTARRYAALPFARKTPGNRLRALLNFNRVPFTRGYGLATYERDQSFPIPPNPSHAMVDARWKAEHPGSSLGEGGMALEAAGPGRRRRPTRPLVRGGAGGGS